MDDPAQGSGHTPVLAAESMEYLAPRPGGTYVDATVGAGGHTQAILERLAGRGRAIGFDKDPAALAGAAPRLRPASGGVELTLIHASFARLRQELATRGITQVDGVIADLGVSSMQLTEGQRGFSFSAEGPLDMRMDPSGELTAETVVNQFGERELADLIYQYGEERRSRRIARAIVRSRPFNSTQQLARVVAAAARAMKSGPGRIHPATRTFQALRIFVNREMEDLTELLAQLPDVLGGAGRAVIISFHSLEDRPVKNSFREQAAQGVYKLLTPHVVRPAEEELRRNPRSRSARLRAVERIGVVEAPAPMALPRAS